MSQIQSSFSSKGGQPKICSPRNTMLYCYTLQFLLHHNKDKFLNIKLKKINKKLPSATYKQIVARQSPDST